MLLNLDAKNEYLSKDWMGSEWHNAGLDIHVPPTSMLPDTSRLPTWWRYACSHISRNEWCIPVQGLYGKWSEPVLVLILANVSFHDQSVGRMCADKSVVAMPTTLFIRPDSDWNVFLPSSNISFAEIGRFTRITRHEGSIVPQAVCVDKVRARELSAGALLIYRNKWSLSFWWTVLKRLPCNIVVDAYSSMILHYKQLSISRTYRTNPQNNP